MVRKLAIIALCLVAFGFSAQSALAETTFAVHCQNPFGYPQDNLELEIHFFDAGGNPVDGDFYLDPLGDGDYWGEGFPDAGAARWSVQCHTGGFYFINPNVNPTPRMVLVLNGENQLLWIVLAIPR